MILSQRGSPLFISTWPERDKCGAGRRQHLHHAVNGSNKQGSPRETLHSDLVATLGSTSTNNLFTSTTGKSICHGLTDLLTSKPPRTSPAFLALIGDTRAHEARPGWAGGGKD